uniref:ADIC dehydrogenase n=1 Tax=Streptoalloteichus sp. ATCC 53650 TaxID=756733 RepID=K4P101_9PSEU|nr:ADIC dehydrogenase [Streptoalloteichus sp. ATCC 53650]
MVGAVVKVLGISGSERPGGSTEKVLDHVGELVRAQGGEFSCVRLRDHEVTPCGACGDCNYRDRPCATRDDVPAIVERMVDADAIIYAAPVHGFGLAHKMQTFIERAGVGYLRFERPLANKVGGVIVISRRYNEMAVYNQLVLNLLLNRMIVVGSGFPALLRGGHPDEWRQDAEGVSSLDRMVRRTLDMARLLRSNATASGEPVLPLDDVNERQARPRAVARAAGR